jgi:hypothetical protein
VTIIQDAGYRQFSPDVPVMPHEDPPPVINSVGDSPVELIQAILYNEINMEITVEFTGAARAVAGVKTILVDLDDESTYRDIVRSIARNYPALVGLLIDADQETFLSGNMFVINGDLATPAMVLSDHPSPGDHLILMSLITGGQ